MVLPVKFPMPSYKNRKGNFVDLFLGELRIHRHKDAARQPQGEVKWRQMSGVALCTGGNGMLVTAQKAHEWQSK